jgi:LmbE family N-acetylglucosaminyl deacetylase
VIVVTPHFGDAVLSCGELLAANPGSIVVTVFAGIPENAFVVPDWDAACGFSSPRQAVTVRRREERRALEVLDAEPCWLNCPESQYRRTVSLDEVRLRLARALRRHRAERIAIPAGMIPGDHATANAAMLALGKPDLEWVVYDDSPPLTREVVATPAERYEHYLKGRAVESYESLQRGYFTAGRDLQSCLRVPERYWTLPR